MRQRVKSGVENGQGTPVGDVSMAVEFHLRDDDLRHVAGSEQKWKVLRPFLPEVRRVAEPTGTGVDVTCSYKMETQKGEFE